MERIRRHFGVLCVAVALVAVVAAVVPQTTVAQTVRAALVKNVDEPGLVPFSQSFTISQTECGCTNCCFIRTAAVPAGKRLVIQNVSGFFPLSAPGNAGFIHVRQETPGTGDSAVINTITPVSRTQWNGGDYPAYEFNQMMLAFVDPGKVAAVSIFSGVSFGFRSGVLTINGYLVNLQ